MRLFERGEDLIASDFIQEMHMDTHFQNILHNLNLVLFD